MQPKRRVNHVHHRTRPDGKQGRDETAIHPSLLQLNLSVCAGVSENQFTFRLNLIKAGIREQRHDAFFYQSRPRISAPTQNANNAAGFDKTHGFLFTLMTVIYWLNLLRHKQQRTDFSRHEKRKLNINSKFCAAPN